MCTSASALGGSYDNAFQGARRAVVFSRAFNRPPDNQDLPSLAFVALFQSKGQSGKVIR